MSSFRFATLLDAKKTKLPMEERDYGSSYLGGSHRVRQGFGREVDEEEKGAQ